VLIVFVLGIVIIWLSGFVSLASITGSALLPFLIILFNLKNIPWLTILLTLLLGAMIIWKHRANIERLRAGNEKRWFEKKESNSSTPGASK
jgi:glycerol-3-phosphate acyltransferase PlsY